MDPRTESGYRERFAPVVDHIRGNPAGDLSVAALARVAHFSPYHFHRVFTAVVGETVGVFVRRARLERAVQLMRASRQRTLGSIALDAGFGSASDFSRAFRRHYGVAPSRWDRRSPLVFRARDSDDRPDPPDDLRAMVRADRGPEIRVTLEDHPPRRLAYVRVREPFREGRLEAGYLRLRAWLSDEGFEERPGELLGMSWDDMDVTPPEQIRYDWACPVPAGTAADDGIGVRDVPGLRVASAPARGDINRVARVWHDLYHRWLPRSSFEPYNLPAFERYPSWPGSTETGTWDLMCCIPVQPLG